MSSSGLCRLKDATLPSGPAHSRRLQIQSFMIAHDKTIITKLHIGEMSYFALAMQAIYVTEESQWSSRDGFLG